MSLLDRIFRTNRSRIYDEGLALLEQGRHAEAVEVLRRAVGEDHATRADSLGGNLLRRALLAEGRRLLRADQPAAAVSYFGEAADLWAAYPDLQWWHGTALGLAGHWEEALQAAHKALRRNSEYPEARLLEAAALMGLARPREAAISLATLRESGRRTDHWLPRHWQDAPEFTAETVPADLPDLLGRVVQGESEKEKLAAAVALCRAGDWEQGTVIFQELVTRRPSYPDYRTRLAAAYFQMRRLDDALAEVETALESHPGYASALDLKVLILADLHRYREAWEFLSNTSVERSGQNPGSLEALFGAYLRGVLALLLGRPGEVSDLLERWSGLAHDFAWAELLAAAADHFRGRRKSCGMRLETLVREWPGDPEYTYLLACFHLERGDTDKAASVLENWPRDNNPEPDQRPLFLQAKLALQRGRLPEFPQVLGRSAAGVSAAEQGVIPRVLPPETWRMLNAEAAFIRGEDAMCWIICHKLEQEGLVSERSLDIMLQCVDAAEASGDWQLPCVVPESCLTGACALAMRRDEIEHANALLTPLSRMHPELLRGMFLRPEFWLQSVRHWLS